MVALKCKTHSKFQNTTRRQTMKCNDKWQTLQQITKCKTNKKQTNKKNTTANHITQQQIIKHKLQNTATNYKTQQQITKHYK